LGQRWVPEQGVVVEVSGEIRDQETGAMRPCISVRVAGYVAHHLSHVLADWSTIGQLLESGRGADETALAAVLHDAANSVGDPGARRCEAPVEPVNDPILGAAVEMSGRAPRAADPLDLPQTSTLLANNAEQDEPLRASAEDAKDGGAGDDAGQRPAPASMTEPTEDNAR
jgi:hypothetical protein